MKSSLFKGRRVRRPYRLQAYCAPGNNSRARRALRILFLLPALAALGAGQPLSDFDTGHTRSTITSNFAVNDAGHSVYTAELPIPPGVAGMQPQLGLHCTSPGDFGKAGRGCELEGRAILHRCGQMEALDGHRSGLELDKAEGPLCYQNQRLVEAETGEGYRTHIDSNVRVVPSTELCEGSPCSFDVREPDGTVHQYGATRESRLTTPSGRPYAWLVSRSIDAHGNYVDYGYASSAASDTERLLRHIDYTGGQSAAPLHRIELFYKNASQPPPGRYVDSVFTEYTQLLDRIEVRTDRAELLYTYRLTHDAEDHLTTIEQCVPRAGNELACYPGEQLTWTSVRPDWDGTPEQFELARPARDIKATNQPERVVRFFAVNDIAHDNDPRARDDYGDLIQVDNLPTSAYANAWLIEPDMFDSDTEVDTLRRHGLSLGQGASGHGVMNFSDFVPIRASLNARTEVLGVEATGPAQCVIRYDELGVAQSTLDLPFCVNKHREIVFGDYDGDGFVDAFDVEWKRIYSAKHRDGIDVALTEDTVVIDNDNQPLGLEAAFVTEDVRWLSGDFNGDGKTDLYRVGRGYDTEGADVAERKNWVFLAQQDGQFKGVQGTRHEDFIGRTSVHMAVGVSDVGIQESRLSILRKSDRANVFPGDFNGDGLTDFYIQNVGSPWPTSSPATMLHPRKSHLLLSRFNGDFELKIAKSAGVDMWFRGNDYIIHTADFNGDGITDVLANPKRTGVPTNEPMQGIYLGQPDGSFSERIADTLYAYKIRLFIAADFDNNGSVDVLTQARGDDHAKLHRFNGRSTSFLTGVNTGQNRSFAVEYVKFPDRKFVGGDVDPTADLDDYISIANPGYLVDRYTEDYGDAAEFTQTVQMGYGYFVANTAQLNPATFDVVQRSLTRDGVEHVKTKRFAFTFPEAGQVTSEAEYIVDTGGTTSFTRKTDYSYSHVEGRVLLTSVSEERGVEGTLATMQTQHDAYGNVIEEAVTLTDLSSAQEASRTTTTRRTFANRVSAGTWRLGLVTESYREADSERRDWQRFTYDARHKPVLVQNALSGGKWVGTTYAYNRRGQTIQKVDPASGTMAITFDESGAYPTRIEQIAQDGDVVASEHVAVDPVHGAEIRHTDSAGVTTEYVRDVFGRPLIVSMSDPTGAPVEVARFSSRVEGRRRVSTTRRRSDFDSEAMVQLQKTENLRGDVLSEMETSFEGGTALGLVRHTQRNSYDAAGRVSRRLLPSRGDNDESIALEYDALGRVVRETFAPSDGDGFVKTYAYGSVPSRRTAISVAEHAGAQVVRKCTVVERNLLGEVGTLIHVDVDAHGGSSCAELVQSDPSDGSSVTQYTYSNFGDLLKVTDPDGVQTTAAYDLGGQATLTVFAGGAETVFEYDDAGRLSRTLDSDGRSETLTYDGVGRVITEVRAQEGHAGIQTRVTYEYDRAHPNSIMRVQFQREAQAGVEPISEYRLSYDIFGRMTQRVHRLHRADPGAPYTDYVTNFDPDLVGQLKALTYPDGSVQRFKRDGYQRITGYAVANQSASDTALKDIVSMEDFDHFDQPQKLSFHKNGAFSQLEHVLDYGSDGLLQSEQIRVRGDRDVFDVSRSSSYSWDLHRIEHIDVQEGRRNSSRESFQYDGLGRLAKATGRYGARIYGYSKGGRLLRKAHLSEDDSAYDVRAVGLNDCEAVPGLIGEMAFDAPLGDHMVRRGTYRYCAQGGSVDLNYAAAFDQAGNMTSVSKPAFLPRARRPLSSASEAGVAAVAPELALGDLYKDFEYIFDHENRLSAVKAAPNNEPGSMRVVARFGYDFAGHRIVSEQMGGANGDEVIRRVVRPTPGYEIVQFGGISLHTKYILHRGVALASTTTSGEAVTLLAADTVLGALDGGMGQRVRNAWAAVQGTVPPETGVTLMLIVMVGSMLVLARRKEGFADRCRAAVATATTWCMLMGATGCGQDFGPFDAPHGSRTAAMSRADGAWFFHVRNQVGSAVGIYDEDGQLVSSAVYTPFGEIFETTGYGDSNSPHLPQFAGKDSVPDTGLFYFEARYYDAVSGRFISADDRPGAQSPHQVGAWNPYTYGLNNPVVYNDPSGHLALFAIAVGALIGGIITGTIAAVETARAGQSRGDIAKAFFAGFAFGALIGGATVATGGWLLALAPSYPTTVAIATTVLFVGAEAAATEFVVQSFDGVEGYDGRDIGIAFGIGAATGLVLGPLGAPASKLGAKAFPKFFARLERINARWTVNVRFSRPKWLFGPKVDKAALAAAQKRADDLTFRQRLREERFAKFIEGDNSVRGLLPRQTYTDSERILFRELKETILEEMDEVSVTNPFEHIDEFI